MTFLVVAFVIPQNVFAQQYLPIPNSEIYSATNTPSRVAVQCDNNLDYTNWWFATSSTATYAQRYLGNTGDPCVPYNADFPYKSDIAPWILYIVGFTVQGNYYYFQLDDEGNTHYFRYVLGDTATNTYVNTPDSEFQTRIISTTPYNNQLTSTSTAFLFNVTGYINADDIQSNIRIRYAYRTLLGDIVNYTFGSDISNEEMISFTATTSGMFNLSATTSVLEIGRYTGRWTIEKPTFSVFGFEFGVQTLYSTTTFFTVATTTNYDNYLAEQSSFLQYLGTEYAGVSCEGMTEFFTNLGYCMYGLFVPNADQMISIWTNFREGFLTKAPWGYGVRVYDIFVGDTATSTLVGLNLTIPVELGLPVAGATINFDPWGTLDTALTQLDTDIPVNGSEPILDTMLYYWNLFVSLAFAWWLVNFVLHHGQHPEDPHKWDEEKKQAHTPSRNTRYDRDQRII